jgi:Recombinase
LNFREACEHAGVSRQRLNQAIASGRLPAERGGGPGKPTYIDLADLKAWCVSEGLAMPVEAIERSERLKPEDMTAFLQRLLPAVEAIERFERRLEEAIERLERSQTEAIAQGIRQALTEFRASIPLERSGTSSMLSQAPRPDREDIITRIRQAKDAEGKSFQQIANELNAEGIATFSGKGVWQKGSVERFYKGH